MAYISFYFTMCLYIDTLPYDTGLEVLLRTCSLLVVLEVLKRH